mmetsp:Transcript_28391/g.37129  ORF Transcript_28391/g.37129 Transcript_28391/m.37129 type:complete len:697 (+) Transcript_28391:163-2253(+)
MIPHFADILVSILSFVPDNLSPAIQCLDFLFLLSILFLSGYYLLGPRSFFKANVEVGQDWWEDLQSSKHASMIIPPFCLKKLPKRTQWTRLQKKMSMNLETVSKNLQTVSVELNKLKESWHKRGSSPAPSSIPTMYPSPTNAGTAETNRGRPDVVKNNKGRGSGGRRSKSRSKRGSNHSSTEKSKSSREGSRAVSVTAGSVKSKQENQAMISGSGRVRLDVKAEEDQMTRITWEGSTYGLYNLPEDVTPLLVFVNGRSGGNQGRKLLNDLRKLLNPLQVFDISDRQQPSKALQQFAKLPRLRVLVCGGDGTVGWVLKELEALDRGGYTPPLAVLPLGTGNDMARVLGWGPGYENKDRLEDVLVGIRHSHVVMLDRWTLALEPTPTEPEETTAKKRKRRRPHFKPKECTFHNYFSVGVDAQTALRFHSNRESMPGLFFSRFINKLWYMVMGTEQAWKRSCSDLYDQVTLVCDGKEIAIPKKAEGIIFLNINSYGGGVSMWQADTEGGLQGDLPRYEQDVNGTWQLRKSSSGTFNCSSFQDGKLDVVAVYGAFHLGQLQVGLSQAVKICQCSEAEMVLKRPYPMQTDGEPWAQPESRIKISCQQNQAFMLAKTEATGGQVATEMTQLLDWAVKTSVITNDQRCILLKEFSRRIEAHSQIAISKKSLIPSIRSYGSLQSLTAQSPQRSLRKTQSMLFSK